MGRTTRPAIGLAVLAAVTLSGCVAPSPAPTRLQITTVRVICGGAVPPPGEPFCRSGVAPRTVDVTRGRVVVATGTSDADGQLLLTVPPGDLDVSVPGAQPYEGCEAAAVTAVSGRITPVTQTCTMLVP